MIFIACSSVLYVTHKAVEKQDLFVSQQRKKPTGRPKLPQAEARSIFISTRLSPAENEEVRSAMKRSGKTKSDWLRAAILGATRLK
jgi:hypothetical protein